MIAIKFNQQEYNYLSKATFLPKKIQKLFCAERKENDFLLTISDELVDEIRDLCGDQLQVAGFNEKYEPTKEGMILEALIDKFFCK